MRTALLFVASFFFVILRGLGAPAQETDDQTAIRKPILKRDQALINDVETAPAALPATLDAALAQALRSNPDVLLANAALRQAEAEYNQAKLQAVQDVTVAFHQWKVRQQQLEVRAKANKQVPGSTPAPEMQQLTSDLAEAEAKLTYLLGLGADLQPVETGRKIVVTPMGKFEKTYVFSRDSGEAVAKAGAADKGAVDKRPEIPEKYRKILQKPMKVKFTAMPLDQIIDQLNKVTGDDLPILRQAVFPFDRGPLNVELAEEVPLQTVLEMVADLTGCVFVFRDYGLLVVPQNSPTRHSRAAMIPEGGY
ncbi:MAG TPA: hypothetical protein VN699_03980 [Pirellulales bacterium]|nr:hypothetical protein [Pirellulales bacterium]